MSKIQTIARALAPAIAIAAAMTFGGGANAAAPRADGFAEGFETISAGLPVGWTVINRSSPVGPETWQPGDAFFLGDPQAGSVESYAMVDFNSTTGAGTISNWLISPTLSFHNGDVVTFWTKSNGQFPDNLELRFSVDTTGVASGGFNVGNTSTSVGSFSNPALVAVNPDLESGVYPTEWAEYSATISGLSGPTDGVIAFRYFVTDGGPTGANSDMIGLDSVSVSVSVVPEPSTYLMMALGLGAIGLRRMRATRS
jgi:hypothetical protein